MFINTFYWDSVSEHVLKVNDLKQMEICNIFSFSLTVVKELSMELLVAGQKPATSIFNSFSEITWEGGLLLERNKSR